MKPWIKILLQIGICVAILGFVGGAAVVLIKFKPEAEKIAGIDEVFQTVEILVVDNESVELRIPTQGMIAPAKQSLLASEVMGKVESVADNFKPGGEFNTGDVMVAIDPSNYKAALAEAKARLADANLALAQEEAQVARARRDWEELGLEGEPTPLVLRKPQKDSADARVDAALAAVTKAENDEKRTEIKAPYKLRIRQIHTEEGSYLGAAAPVADVYSVSPFEISLPLSLQDYAFVPGITEERKPTVKLTATAGIQRFEWDGVIVRNTGEVDRNSRSVNLVAKVEGKENDLLQPGLFVQAVVEGVTLENIVKVPLSAFHDLDQLVLVDQRDELQFRKVTVLRRQGNEALISEGLDEGDRVCITALDTVVQGMKVEIAEPDPETESNQTPKT